MTTTADYPRKLFYRIQEVAQIVGVEPYVLRYWETKFPMLSPEKDGSDQRRYRQKDIDILLRIRELLYVEKYTIAGAVEKLKDELRGGRPPRTAAAGPEQVEGDLFANSFEQGADRTSGEDVPRLGPEQVDAFRHIREELGLLRRELEEWRDEVT